MGGRVPLAPFVQIPKLDDRGQPVIGRDGRVIQAIGVNPVKQHVRGYWLVSDPLLFSLTVAAPTVELKFLIDSQGHFDWAYIVGKQDQPYFIQFFDPGTQRRLQNKPMHSTNVVGSGRRPFRLPEPYFFNVGDAQREVIVTVSRLAADVTDAQLVLYGRRFYHKEAPPDVGQEINRKFGEGWRTYSYFLMPKEYGNDGVPPVLAAGATTTFTFDMDNSADTDLHKIMAQSTGAFKFALRERDTNRTISNGTIHSTNGWGNAEFPFYFADSFLLERQKQLLCEITDLSGDDNSIFLTMAGRRLQYR
jgi:hypothetical protein